MKSLDGVSSMLDCLMDGLIGLSLPPVQDWSVLTNRIDGLAQRASAFELLCFIDNHDTDTQVRMHIVDE